ncbi:hypothetical protein [Flavobacterium sp. JP2137]|uniref:hypothetical protein n=1 Tax=Flavobacterium sp. JP2137 TaxID=3414510 RepID=UPI003D2FC2A8
MEPIVQIISESSIFAERLEDALKHKPLRIPDYTLSGFDSAGLLPEELSYADALIMEMPCEASKRIVKRKIDLVLRYRKEFEGVKIVLIPTSPRVFDIYNIHRAFCPEGLIYIDHLDGVIWNEPGKRFEAVGCSIPKGFD